MAVLATARLWKKFWWTPAIPSSTKSIFTAPSSINPHSFFQKCHTFFALSVYICDMRKCHLVGSKVRNNPMQARINYAQSAPEVLNALFTFHKNVTKTKSGLEESLIGL